MAEELLTEERSRTRDWIFLVLGIALVLLPMIWFPTSGAPAAEKARTEAPAVPDPDQEPEKPPTQPGTDQPPAVETPATR